MSPGTSRMKARVVSLMFCFGSTSTGKSCFVVDLMYFVLPSIKFFCVHKCYQNGANFSTVEKVLFCVSQFASEGKTDERKEFMTAEGTVKVCFVTFQQISG